MFDRRSLLVALVLLAIGSRASAQVGLPLSKLPRTGKAGPELELLDETVMTLMLRHGIPGASLAIVDDGKLVLARGYGYADRKGTKVEPTTTFALSSLSKPVTAVATLMLVERGMLDLDQPVLEYLDHIPPLPKATLDLRLKKVTIRHCLNHTGGWDRNESGDPIDQVVTHARELGLTHPITHNAFITRVWDVPLDFEPGSKFVYSNVGYILLGACVEKATAQTYEEFVQEEIFRPLGITTAKLHYGEQEYFQGESERFLAGGQSMPPLQRNFANAAMGWSASSVDMVRFLAALDGTHGQRLLKPETFKLMVAKPPKPYAQPEDTPVYPGLGWPQVLTSPDGKAFTYFQDGRNYGSRAFMKRNGKGVNWVLLFNACMDPDRRDNNLVKDNVKVVSEKIEARGEYPDVDFFADYTKSE